MKPFVIEQVEIASLDLRYEGCRMKNKVAEKGLLVSIAERGIQEALQGVSTEGNRILLDGFKRCRCARRLGIAIVPYISVADKEVIAIAHLIRTANSEKLNILEQARFIEELRTIHKMAIAEIAELLERSQSWVGMRSGIIQQMSQCVLEKIFNGAFPGYAYVYTLRRFLRMKCVQQKEIDEFVVALAGKNLSIREIEFLAGGFFHGGEEFRQQILKGDITWGLKRLKESKPPSACSEFELSMLRDLEIIKKYLQKVSYGSKDKRLKSNSFFAQATLLIGGIGQEIELFSKAIEDLNDRSKEACGNLATASRRNEHQADS
jgi:hypothetical protein